MKKIFYLIFLVSFINVSAQYEEYSFGAYTIELKDHSFLTLDSLNQIIFAKTFIGPSLTLSDMNKDGSDEIIIIDSLSIEGQDNYRLYFYGITDSIYLIDSVYSGVTQPFETEFDEVDGSVFIVGNIHFNEFNRGDTRPYLPINCLMFDGLKLVLVNDLLYDIFIDENEMILQNINDFFDLSGKNCSSSESMLPMIVSAYVNYVSAGEYSSAAQLINNFYFCQDKAELKNKIQQIMEK